MNFLLLVSDAYLLHVLLSPILLKGVLSDAV